MPGVECYQRPPGQQAELFWDGWVFGPSRQTLNLKVKGLGFAVEQGVGCRR